MNFFFIMVPLTKSIKVWYSKAQGLGFKVSDTGLVSFTLFSNNQAPQDFKLSKID